MSDSTKAAQGFGAEFLFLSAYALRFVSFARAGPNKDSALGPKVQTITVADDYLINSTVKVDLNGDDIPETVASYSGIPGKYLVTVPGLQALGLISAQGGYSLIKGEVVENKIDLLTPAGWTLDWKSPLAARGSCEPESFRLPGGRLQSFRKNRHSTKG
jgi:hypothetical protein